MSKSSFLVYGGFAGGSGWSGVCDIPKKEGRCYRLNRIGCRPQLANTWNKGRSKCRYGG